MTSSRSLILAAPLLALISQVAPAGATAAAYTPPCHRITVSPNYRSDHLVWCTWSTESGTAQMAVSKDGAHSWRQVPMTGFSYTPHAFNAVSRVIPSPEFAHDHAE